MMRIRDAYELYKFLEKNYWECGTHFSNKADEMKKELWEQIKQINQGNEDTLARSMRDAWRHIGDESGEGGYDFRIVADKGETVEDIRYRAQIEVGYPPIYSLYDCTGKRFTRWITVRRVPAGFAVVHSWGTDV